ncbi:histidine phosphatase family protein [Heyndrickxia acidicola]|uniref:Histidine phosphatase family protein n=1 Tax=Heyndrickxia acidicola TaxID=209389 RepID=A0ABU6MM26_9BACI|nr:histidine phosphatase family protein [Heyndrickxia acidicola]MED1205737.1 histidine phosphatase family protein [Heyndrickxia acidicola]
MLTNLYFVRHAHSVYSPDELIRPLSKKGAIDAVKVTVRLRNEKIDDVISSPYKRAVKTVEGIANLIGKEVVKEYEFRERLLSGKPLIDFQSAINKVWEDESFSFSGGESNNAARERGGNAALQVLKDYEGKNVVIGTHGNIMVLTMNFFDGKIGLPFWRALDMPDIYKLSFKGKELISMKRLWKNRL